MFDLAGYIMENFPQLYALIQKPQNQYADKWTSQWQELRKQLLKRGVACTPKGLGFIATCGGTTLDIHGSTTGLNGKRVRLVCKDKYLTKQILSEDGLRVPRGFLYRYAEMPAEDDLPLPFPFVLKPVDGSQGAHVHADVRSYDDVRNYWASIKPQTTVLMEEFIPGIDLRCCVVNGKMVAAASRINAHVFGDGKSSIRELIQQKMLVRKKNPNARDDQLIVDPSVSVDAVPPAGKMMVLNPLSNLSAGGDAVNVTPFLSAEVRSRVERSVACIEGAKCVSVDAIAQGFDDPEKICFIEFNSSASFILHQYPAFGEPIAYGEIIADYIKERLSTAPLGDELIQRIAARNQDNPDVYRLVWGIQQMRKGGDSMHA